MLPPPRGSLGGLRRSSRHLGGRDLRAASRDPVRDDAGHEAARANGIVVPGDHERRLVRVCIRVHEPDHGNPEALRLPDGELLLLHVQDEDRVGLSLHVRDSAEIRLELLELGLHRHALLGRQQVELSVGLQAAQVVQVRDALGDGLPVREQAAEPAVVDVGHAYAGRVLGHSVLCLLLRADEEDRALALRDVACELVGLLEQLLGLREVDDVDPAALAEDVPAHLGVPATGLVAEVDAGLQQLPHGDD